MVRRHGIPDIALLQHVVCAWPVDCCGSGNVGRRDRFPIYSQAGTRRICGARSENCCALQKGAEIVVTRYDKGIAYVRLWDEMNNEELKTEN
jgi:hypothetical protein